MCLFRVTRAVADFSAPPLGKRLGQGSRHPARGTINPWAPRGVSSLGILAGYAHTVSLERPDSVQKILAACICRGDGWELLAGSPAIVCQYDPWLHVSKCTVATKMLFGVKLISSMPDHATHEAGIASRCEPMPNLLGQSAT
jgi:hypothetical protein